MNIVIKKEEKGYLVYTVQWINIAGKLSVNNYDTEREVVAHVKHLLALGYKINQIHVLRDCNISFQLGDIRGKE